MILCLNAKTMRYIQGPARDGTITPGALIPPQDTRTLPPPLLENNLTLSKRGSKTNETPKTPKTSAAGAADGKKSLCGFLWERWSRCRLGGSRENLECGCATRNEWSCRFRASRGGRGACGAGVGRAAAVFESPLVFACWHRLRKAVAAVVPPCATALQIGAVASRRPVAVFHPRGWAASFVLDQAGACGYAWRQTASHSLLRP